MNILWRILRIIPTLIIIFISFMIFKFSELSTLGQALAGIFTSNGQGFSDVGTASLFKNNVFFIIAASIACTPVAPALKKLAYKFRAGEVVWEVLAVVMPIILIVLSALSLAGDSFNPFLYFQF